MRRRTSAAWRTTSSPTTLAVPAVGSSNVISIAIMVVLPAPLGPNKA